MYSAINGETLAECCLVFGLTCLAVAMCPATSEPTNSPTSQQAQSLLRSTRTVFLLSTVS